MDRLCTVSSSFVGHRSPPSQNHIVTVHDSFFLRLYLSDCLVKVLTLVRSIEPVELTRRNRSVTYLRRIDITWALSSPSKIPLNRCFDTYRSNISLRSKSRPPSSSSTGSANLTVKPREANDAGANAAVEEAKVARRTIEIFMMGWVAVIVSLFTSLMLQVDVCDASVL